MFSIKTTKRTKYVRDTIQQEWYDRWWKFILDNPDKDWNWYNIYGNPFSKEKEDFQMKRYREHLAAILIQNIYKNALVDPNCQLGINRIERDMDFAGI
jgi:hypothetical protein